MSYQKEKIIKISFHHSIARFLKRNPAPYPLTAKPSQAVHSAFEMSVL